MNTIVVVNGPNLNLLGKRETNIYGVVSFEEYFGTLVKKYDAINFIYVQSNHEGVLIDKLQEFGFEPILGIIFNPGAYTHTSIALMDCIKAISTPVVEVHISNIHKRESFRHHSYISLAAIHQIMGQGIEGYDQAIQFLLKKAR